MQDPLAVLVECLMYSSAAFIQSPERHATTKTEQFLSASIVGD